MNDEAPTAALPKPALERALAMLEEKRVVAAPTESSYGLLADAASGDALDRLFELKPRAAGVALMLPDRDSWRSLVTSIPPLAARLAERFWPGGLTIALPRAAHVDRRVTVDGTVGVRLPGPCAAASVAAAFGRPLTATSANRHGASPAMSSDDVRGAFQPEIVTGLLHVVEGRALGAPPSSIVVVDGDRAIVVRVGAVAEAAILREAGQQSL